MTILRTLFSAVVLTAILSTLMLAADPGTPAQAQPTPGAPANVFVVAGQPQTTGTAVRRIASAPTQVVIPQGAITIPPTQVTVQPAPVNPVISGNMLSGFSELMLALIALGTLLGGFALALIARFWYLGGGPVFHDRYIGDGYGEIPPININNYPPHVIVTQNAGTGNGNTVFADEREMQWRTTANHHHTTRFMLSREEAPQQNPPAQSGN